MRATARHAARACDYTGRAESARHHPPLRMSTVPPLTTRPPLALRIAGGAATVAAGALLAVVIAFWGWRWFGPTSPAPPSPHEPASWAPAIAASAIFGSAGAPAQGAAASAPVTLSGDTRLLGVFAERDGGGYALFRLAGAGAVLVRAGAQLADGVTLVAVRPDGVRIDDHGQPRELALRPVVSPVAAAKGAPLPAGARSACVLPAGYRGPVYRLNAELLTGLSAQPANWQSLVTPGEGALVVRDGSGLAAALGLAAGDRITQANGIALARIDDVVTAIVRPLLASQPVRVSGSRGGKPLEWMLVNAGACPV